MRIFYVLIVAMLCLAQTAVCADYYIDLTGSDATGDGSIARPWRTLQYAVSKVPANQGHTIRLSAGTYIEAGRIDVPAGVNIEGSGKDVTILKASSSFYYYPASPGYATDKFLISLSGSSYASGNQSLKNFTIDGDGKKLHGGIYVRYRTFVTIDGVKVTGTNFTAIWLWDVKDSRMTNTDLVNCSWGSTGYQVGALNVGNLERVEIDHCYIDENTGYGIKAIGPSGYNDILYTKIHDCRITVNPTGLWNNGSAPNIAIELWQVDPLGCEIYSCYIDNTVSLVNANNNPSTGNQTIRVHHNVIDLASRANGAGYAIELTMHDVEIDHNYIVKGSYGIANWDNPMKNWNIHHNTFYNIEGTYPGEIVRSQWSGLHNVNFYNNTVEFAGTKTANLLGVYGGASDNINLKNNLIINSNTAYSYYPNQLIHMENGATLSVLAVTNNLLFNLPVGSVPGTYAGNLTGDPSVQKSGSRPDPYYLPNAGSPLIDAGINLGFPFLGGAPDIGAYEYAGSGPANTPPVVSIASPANNTSFTAGNSITISANASDTDGAVSKVEFFNGATKLGEDLTSPYDFGWSNIPSGTYLLTAKATDDKGAATTSAVVSITVLAANVPPVVSITTPANNASFNAGSSVVVSATASDTDGAVNKVEFFNGTTKLGEDLTSPYDFGWSNMPSGTYLLTAKATDDKGAATTSAVVSITVLAANLPPVVSITSPANNASFNAGNSVTINANASDADGTISKVEFFRGTTKLGEDLTSPYSFAWTKVPAGAYTLTAKATDNLGVATTSAGVAITVNALPLVSITSPTANTAFTPGSSIPISANASDSDGTVVKVEFFQGTVKLGEDLSSPYNYTWSNVASGIYSLSARATDNKGAFRRSTAVSITVNAPPSVSIASPINNASFTEGSSITITASAADSDGTVAKVEFFNGATKLGEDLTTPYTCDWVNVSTGTYTLTAKATDNQGAPGVSQALSVSILPASTTLGLYAPDAALTGNMKLVSDVTATKGSYFAMPPGSGTNYYIPPASGGQFNFVLGKSDTYYVWVRLKSPGQNNQGFHIYDGKGHWTTWITGVYTEWTWVQVTDAYTNQVTTFPFTEGTNSLRMGWFEEDTRVDGVMVTNDPAFDPSQKSGTATARSQTPALAAPEVSEPADTGVAMYPNPVRDRLTINYFSDSRQEARILVKSATSMSSKQLVVTLDRGWNNIELNMSGEQNGMYLVSITGADGRKCWKKIIVAD